MDVPKTGKTPSFIVILSIALVATVVSTALTGCGSSGSSPETSGTPAAQGAQTETEERITVVMNDFLKAVRSGRNEEIFKFFSPKARAVCQADMISALPANDSSQFEIQKIVLNSEDEAQVLTVMIDADHRGNEYRETLGWALKNTEEGWRIVGTAFELFEGMDLIAIDFENPGAIEAAQAQAEAQEKRFNDEIQRLQEIERQKNQPRPENVSPQIGSEQTPSVNK